MGKSRKPDALYTGARGRLTLDYASTLGKGYIVQPKFDGSYAVVTTDAKGRFARAIFRSGALMSAKMIPAFSGLVWRPNATLVCELEVWTEASNRIAATRGYRMAHVFDCLRMNGQDMTRRPYRERYASLMRAESALMCDDLDKPWLDDGHDRAHGSDGRYVKRVPQSWRRMRVVPQMRTCDVDRAWYEWTVKSRDPIEGLVVVAQDAPVGKRAAKRKIKEHLTLDCRVLDTDGKRMTLEWHGRWFVVGCNGKTVTAGDTVEVQCDGLYESTETPKFPRVTRVRHDL